MAFEQHLAKPLQATTWQNQRRAGEEEEEGSWNDGEVEVG